MGNNFPYAPRFKGQKVGASYGENCYSSLKNYKAKNQGKTGTCYAYAIAGIIVLASERVHGRAPLDFNQIKNYIIQNYGEKEGGGNVNKILMNTKLLSEYRLRCREITRINDVIDILLNPNPRPLLATFYLSGKEWNSLAHFFEKFPGGILKKEDLVKYYNPNFESQSGGHAIIIMGCYYIIEHNCRLFYFSIANSWGESWANKGYFKAAIDVTEFRFYDVYWTESDLSLKERMRYFNDYPEEFD
jgi:hypothetical protein